MPAYCSCEHKIKVRADTLTHSDTINITMTADSAFNAFKISNLNYIENVECALAKFCHKWCAANGESI